MDDTFSARAHRAAMSFQDSTDGKVGRRVMVALASITLVIVISVSNAIPLLPSILIAAALIKITASMLMGAYQLQSDSAVSIYESIHEMTYNVSSCSRLNIIDDEMVDKISSYAENAIKSHDIVSDVVSDLDDLNDLLNMAVGNAAMRVLFDEMGMENAIDSLASMDDHDMSKAIDDIIDMSENFELSEEADAGLYYLNESDNDVIPETLTIGYHLPALLELMMNSENKDVYVTG